MRYCLYCILSVILLTSCNHVTQKEKESSADTVNVLYRLGKLNELIEDQPANAELYYKRAALHMERGLFPAAVNDAKMAVKFDSLNASYYLFLADVSFRALMIQEAVDAFKKCLSIAPGNLDANLKFSELNLYLKAYPDALKYANDALRIDEKQVRAYFVKGFVYKETGDTSKAISSFQTAVEVDPENYDAYIQLGNILSARGSGIALQYYNNALRLRPASTEALYNRGLFLQENGKYELAENDYRTILKIDQGYADAYYNLGYIQLVIRQNPDESIPFFTDAIRVSPEFVQAFYNRGMAFQMKGDKASARKDFLKALSISPDYKMAKEQLRLVGGK
jgi:tetratricopeptide (TPR) repeat protein